MIPRSLLTALPRARRCLAMTGPPDRGPCTRQARGLDLQMTDIDFGVKLFRVWTLVVAMDFFAAFVGFLGFDRQGCYRAGIEAA